MRMPVTSVRRIAALTSASVALCVSLLAATAGAGHYEWDLPDGFPVPFVPADNPMSAEKVELGRHLFYDTRLSGNGTESCATCHDQARAFTDGRARSRGATGEENRRGSMSLVNVAYAATLTWADPALTRLEDQVLVPMYGTHPVELGLDPGDGWLTRFAKDAVYQRLFGAAFPGDQAVTRTHVVQALASFARSIVSARSPWDRYHFNRDDSAVSAAVRRGEVLFNSRPLSCFRCHGGATFSSPTRTSRRSPAHIELHNTGLYNLAGSLSYPPSDPGAYEVTGDPADVGRFKAPTLRNIAVTAPYMHDGSVATLDEAIDHYAAGGRTIADGPRRGVGRENPNKDAAIRGFTLTPGQRADLIAFLHALTDTAALHDPRFANPWPAGTPGPR